MAQLTVQEAIHLALQHHQAGRLQQAEDIYRRILAQQPNHADALHLLGLIAHQVWRNDIAVDLIRRSIVLKPGSPAAHSNLGNALKDKGLFEEAIDAYRQAIALKPDYPEAHLNLGNALKDKGRLDEAVAAYRQAITFDPNCPEAHGNLGVALKFKGQFDEAIAACRQALALNPNLPGTRSNLVFILHYHPGHDAQSIAEEQRRWNRQHAEPLKQHIQPHDNDQSPDRRLRIGYVSPDFCDHVVGRNLLPLCLHADRQQFEIICYAQVLRPDAITAQFQAYADHWRGIVGVPDEQLAQLIRQDRIDVLVDLALHTAQNRLLVFARKPAPVQVSFAGYPASTGLSAIDYRLSDPYLDPPDIDESVYSEQTIRLPHSFWCYDPLECRGIPINSLPALQNGVVTFGCLNNFCKVNEQALALWAQVLRQVEDSRLLLLSEEGIHHQRTLDFLKQEGVNPDRVEFVPRQPRQKYMELYQRIDLGLDTFPYNGHTTSLDSFWMGVPVVTLVGQTPVSRAGWCQLSNLGLPGLAAQTQERFVEIAVELAEDLSRLQDLRQTLRQRMEQSPLMDAAGFARGIEAAYRQMWRRWCEQASAMP